MILGSGLIVSSWPQASDWLIRDEFTDTRAAGSVNGTAAQPGPGTRTNDTGTAGIGSGVLASGAAGETFRYSDAFAVSTGLAIAARVDQSFVGWDTNTTSSLSMGHIRLIGTSVYIESSTNGAYGSITDDGTMYTVCNVMRSDGTYLFLLKGGSEYPNWTLITTTDATIRASGTIYPGLYTFENCDFFRVIALPAPFDTDDGAATDVLSGSVAAGTTFSHTADMLLEFTQTTLQSAGYARVRFRVQDTSNYWELLYSFDGYTVLNEIVSGTPTSRGAAAGASATGYRVVIVCDGQTIKIYTNNILRISYSSATNFATATAGEVDALGTGGAVSDLKTWPRTLSGTAASILNKVSA